MEAFTVLAAVNTIGKTAQAAWDVAEILQCFINDVRNVDQTVRELHLEVTKLREACTLARDQLDDLARLGGSDGDTTERKERTDARLWKCFDDQTRDCNRTLDQLSQSIGAENHGRKSVLKRAWRQIQLNMSTAEMRAVRARIRSHTDSLQIILLTIKM